MKLLTGMFLIMFAAKIFGMTELSWFWVTAPIWMSWTIGLPLVGLMIWLGLDD